MGLSLELMCPFRRLHSQLQGTNTFMFERRKSNRFEHHFTPEGSESFKVKTKLVCVQEKSHGS